MSLTVVWSSTLWALTSDSDLHRSRLWPRGSARPQRPPLHQLIMPARSRPVPSISLHSHDLAGNGNCKLPFAFFTFYLGQPGELTEETQPGITESSGG